MSLIEDQPHSPSEGLQIPGLVQSQESVEQLSFTTNPTTPMPISAPVSQNGVLHPADMDTAPRLVSQADIEEKPLPQPAPARYSGGPSSSPGLADIDTAPRPISQAGITHTLPPQSASMDLPGGPGSSLRPLSQAGITRTLPPLSDSTGLPGGSDSSSAPGTLQPISQEGLERAMVPREPTISNTTRALLLNSRSGITQGLTDARSTSNTAGLRSPVVIRGSDQPKARSIRPPQGRRHVISIAALVLLVVITMGTLLVSSPLGRDVRATLGVQPGGPNVIQGTPNNMNLVAQATATAVVHQQTDGYDPTSKANGPVVTGSPESWPLGVCTYWANLRYHALTGHWVTWTGNAYQWADGAHLAGWNVSSSPHVPSIIVLMPGVQGASGYGHVAVVESANGNSVSTSNMNWYTNGGGWDRESYNTFTAGSGVFFIWA